MKVCCYLIGVFQGCTLSTILFNVIYNLLVEWLKGVNVEGYSFNGSTVREILYADDTKFITKSFQDNQLLLDGMSAFFQWSQCLRVKVAKCITFGMARFRKNSKHQRTPLYDKDYSPYDPVLQVDNETIPFIGNGALQCLGRHIYITLDETKIREKVKLKLEEMLEKVNTLPLNGLQKFWMSLVWHGLFLYMISMFHMCKDSWRIR